MGFENHCQILKMSMNIRIKWVELSNVVWLWTQPWLYGQALLQSGCDLHKKRKRTGECPVDEAVDPGESSVMVVEVRASLFFQIPKCQQFQGISHLHIPSSCLPFFPGYGWFFFIYLFVTLSPTQEVRGRCPTDLLRWKLPLGDKMIARVPPNIRQPAVPTSESPQLAASPRRGTPNRRVSRHSGLRPCGQAPPYHISSRSDLFSTDTILTSSNSSQNWRTAKKSETCPEMRKC